MSFSHREPRIIFLTGAPSCHDLDASDLTTDLLPSIERFIHSDLAEKLPTPSSSNNWPNWRRLSDRRNHAPGDGDIAFKQEDSDHAFLTQDEQAESDYQFLEHSLMTYTRHDLEAADADETEIDESTLLGESFLSEITEDSYYSPLKAQPIRWPASVTDLRRLPGASEVIKSNPQTITVNLLVGIISVKPPSTITARKTGLSFQLTEVMVGDETNTGFAITLWSTCSSASRSVAQAMFETRLRDLRPRQVVLMTNIALHVYQGQLYGQSQRDQRSKGIGTNLERLDGHENAVLPIDLQRKQDRIEKWVLDFLHVGVQTPKTPLNRLMGKRTHGTLMDDSQLPPDTL